MAPTPLSFPPTANRLTSALARPFQPPTWRELERTLGAGVRLHPHVLSCLKLVVALPMLWALIHPDAGSVLARAWGLPVLFVLFAALDYLDGLVAREQGLESGLGRILDRITDAPVLITLSALTARDLPTLPLMLKLALDALLMLLFALGHGSTHNRLRTTASYASLFALLLLSQNWAPQLFSVALVAKMLWLNAAISCAIVLRRLGVLRRQRVADLLSLSNLACGVFSLGFSARGEFMPCLFLLALGATLDGLDGAAARRWGGSAWGVYMDDLADAVSYGVAPGYALYAAIGGREGTWVGVAFALFVITRLTYFTLNKRHSDPNFFRGVPSTVGGLITISTLLVLPHSPLAVGFLVGLACAAMVSFDVQHRHLGRALTSRSARRYALWFVLVLAFGAAVGGVRGAAWLVLFVSLGYGFLPSLVALWRCLTERRGAEVRPERPASSSQTTG